MKKIADSPLLSSMIVMGGFAVIGATLFLLMYLFRPTPVDSRTFPGGVATIGTNNRSGTTTNQTLTVHTPTQITATSTCVARTITTVGGDITISFYDGAPTLGQYNGHWQGATTTVTYDSDQFGCGLLRVFAVASTTITVTESN